MQLYVFAKSKRALNERLAAGQEIYGTEYRMGEKETFLLGGEGLQTCKARDGCVIKIYDRVISGNPYAKDYGIWDAAKHRVK